MANFEFPKSSIIMNFIERAKEMGYGCTAEDVIDFYDTTIESMAVFLGKVKNKKTKTAIAIKDLKGNLKMASIVSYHPNEENEDLPGNWNLVFTFDKNDIDDTTIYESTDTQFQKIASQVTHKSAGFRIESPSVLQSLYELTVDCLLYWADANAKEDEESKIEQKGYFEFSTIIEDGEKIYTLVPDGNMKRLIKDDADLEEK